MPKRFVHWLAGLAALANLADPCAAAARDPAEPTAAVPAVRYIPVTRGLKNYRPVEPKPWGAVNQQVTPPPKAQPSAGAKK